MLVMRTWLRSTICLQFIVSHLFMKDLVSLSLRQLQVELKLLHQEHKLWSKSWMMRLFILIPKAQMRLRACLRLIPKTTSYPENIRGLKLPKKQWTFINLYEERYCKFCSDFYYLESFNSSLCHNWSFVFTFKWS